VGLVVKHRRLERQVGAFADNHWKNSMASSNSSDLVLTKGTTITFGSWVLVANGSSGFNAHLADPNALETSEST